MSLISFLIVEYWQLLLPITIFAFIIGFLKRTSSTTSDLDDDINSNLPEKVSAQKVNATVTNRRNQLPDDGENFFVTFTNNYLKIFN